VSDATSSFSNNERVCFSDIISDVSPRQQQVKDAYEALRVIRNECRVCNNLSYTIHLRQEYVVALMDLEVYVPPLPASIPELKARIRTAIETITADMLQSVWNELDYRVDVCSTKGAHIEHL